MRFIFVAVVCLIFIQIFSNEIVSAQNLVPNPSFEDEVDFDSRNTGNWSRCLKNDTPDYFRMGKNKNDRYEGIIFNGEQEPNEGKAFVGIFCYRVNPLRGVTDVREFIQITLLEPLIRDSLYDISLYICLDEESNVAINNFNIYFSEVIIKEKHERMMYEKRSQISFRKNYYDNASWIKLENLYRAKGKEKVMVIGNFISDKGIRVKEIQNSKNLNLKWELGEYEKAAYYYIDLVSISPHKLKTEIVLPDPPEESSDTSSNTSFDIDEIEEDTPVILKNILFEFDKDILLAKSYGELNRLFSFMIEHELLKIHIEGHTDNIGSHEYNIDLSSRRAKAVANYLIQKGIDSERITWQGYGKTCPLNLNETEEGRQLNRRVAFRIILE